MSNLVHWVFFFFALEMFSATNKLLSGKFSLINVLLEENIIKATKIGHIYEVRYINPIHVYFMYADQIRRIGISILNLYHFFLLGRFEYLSSGSL